MLHNDNCGRCGKEIRKRDISYRCVCCFKIVCPDCSDRENFPSTYPFTGMCNACKEHLNDFVCSIPKTDRCTRCPYEFLS